jgi:hypothetical protein
MCHGLLTLCTVRLSSGTARRLSAELSLIEELMVHHLLVLAVLLLLAVILAVALTVTALLVMVHQRQAAPEGAAIRHQLENRHSFICCFLLACSQLSMSS